MNLFGLIYVITLNHFLIICEILRLLLNYDVFLISVLDIVNDADNLISLLDNVNDELFMASSGVIYHRLTH